MRKSPSVPLRRLLAAALLAGLLLLGGCGGEFWGGVGDWEPGELGAGPAQPTTASSVGA
ncbi:MAG: hypothetical protein KJ720_12540 [Proteobacteria bacterium]|nr:hypothetical protein [Pseudomonadota bacterium]MBU1451571.1 hypothetical protein [Pseudomonadota bacterium]MBU2470607.1 hypothetical protein [Pseudomonadota bacterium]MBU2519201.1 hypothetical protein [Pseudomonadota bacterium]